MRCTVTYKVTSQWSGGFTGDVAVAVTGGTVNGWTLTFAFANGQQITNAWNATVRQAGTAVTATDAGWNAQLGTADWGFNGTWNGTNANPTAFSLNGTACAAG
jgi:cellulase/cellobiase CelA1